VADAPLFRVIIPTYGRAELLHSALSSVLSETMSDFEGLRGLPLILGWD